MAGAGPELKRLMRQAKALGLAEDVVFPGYVPHENIASLYLDADVFLAPGIAQPEGSLLNAVGLVDGTQREGGHTDGHQRINDQHTSVR